MVSIYEFSDYRTFIKTCFNEMPKQGYGQSQKWAHFLGVHTTLISQILKGLKSLTPEQAALTCDFLGLNDSETDFFLILVQWDRAGNESLRKILRKQIDLQRQKASELVHRLQSEKRLQEENRAIFYSDWTYSAIRQLTAIPGYQSLDEIAAYFQLPKKRTKHVLDFLLATGLCKERNNEIHIGPSSTHLEAGSPWVRVHHLNWRQKAIEEISYDEESKLHYTAPMTLSKDDALKVREMIIQFLEKVDQVMDPSPSEELHCLNIDWFKVK